jgi:hypothetical protein
MPPTRHYQGLAPVAGVGLGRQTGWSVRDAREQLPVLLASDRPVVVGPGSGVQGVVMSKQAYDDLCDRAVFAATTLASLSSLSGQATGSGEAAADLQAYVRGTLTLDQLRSRALERYQAAS